MKKDNTKRNLILLELLKEVCDFKFENVQGVELMFVTTKTKREALLTQGEIEMFKEWLNDK